MGVLDFLLTSWYDFVDNRFTCVQPTTDEIAKRYIPQDDVVQRLYDCHRVLGEDISQALTMTLEAASGTK